MEKTYKKVVKYSTIILIVIIIMEIMALFGVFGGDDGCFFRYNFNKDSRNYNLNDSAISASLTLNANGRYNIDPNLNSNNAYGKWVKANLLLTKDNPVKIHIEGEVSLCKSYLTAPNLQSDNLPKDYRGNDKKIEIPRIGTYKSTGTTQDYVSLIFDSAKHGSNWRNVVDVTPGDKVLLTINPNSINSNVSFANDLYGQYKQADCTKDMANPIGATSPLCGRYPSTKINGTCIFKADPIPEPAYILYEVLSCQCKYRTAGGAFAAPPSTTYTQVLNPTIFSMDSIDYLDDKYCKKKFAWDRADRAYTEQRKWGYSIGTPAISLIPYSVDTERMRWPDIGNGAMNCDNCIPQPSKRKNQNICYGSGVDATKMWFTANNIVGLRQRLTDDKGEKITDPKDIIKILTTANQSTDINDTGSYYDGKSPPYAIYNDSPPVLSVDSKQYLQLAFQEGAGPGGYVVNIQHTKCIRRNGSAPIDSGSKGLYRGKIKYLLLPYGQDPNQLNIKDGTGLDFDVKGDSTEVIALDKYNPDQSNGAFLWFKIDNVESDYKDSSGSYILKMNYTLKADDFLSKILNPIITMIKDKVLGNAKLMFQRMTCSGKHLGDSTCTNYFRWIKAILTIYIIIIGMQFLLGMAKFNSQELIIRLMKIIVVGGLINGNTFIFFQETLFPLITDTLDQIISNISGYNPNLTIYSEGQLYRLNTPFIFLNNFMTKFLFNKVFVLQMLSTLSLAFFGIPFFLIIAYSLLNVLIVIINSISVYIMSFMFIGLLIIIGPIFLVFMLFDRTRYLFNNWVAYLIRYCLEPVLILAGITILLQLYEIYLDQILGFSVCWKCAWPFTLFLMGFCIPGLPIIIGPTKTLFCINWFVPWGYSYEDVMTNPISFYDIIAILILSKCMTHYISFISQASEGLFTGPGDMGGPSVSNTPQATTPSLRKR